MRVVASRNREKLEPRTQDLARCRSSDFVRFGGEPNPKK